jgi:hypothetical protein
MRVALSHAVLASGYLPNPLPQDPVIPLFGLSALIHSQLRHGVMLFRHGALLWRGKTGSPAGNLGIPYPFFDTGSVLGMAPPGHVSSWSCSFAK